MLRTGLITAVVALFGFGLLGPVPAAFADPPWKRGRDAGYEDGRGGPPPWAPAHGYRRKHERKDRDKRHHVRVDPAPTPTVIDVGLGRCNRDLIGAVLGGAVGGAIGSQVGEGAGRAIVTAGGVIVGAIIGGTIGRRMDERDRACVVHALDLAPQGRMVRWDNAETGVRYELTPLGLYLAEDGRSCREYVTKAVIDAKPRWSRGVACRQPDGGWQRAG